MTETFGEGNVDTGIQSGAQQVDNFSKELGDFLLDDKLTNKEEISNLLVSNPDLKTGFEEFLKTANLKQKIKCKKELQNCSTVEEIKSIILENFPEGYKMGSIEVGSNMEIVKTEVEDEDLINLKEQARTDTEQARTDTEQARTDTEQAEENKKGKDEAEKSNDSLNAMMDAVKYVQNLKENHQNLDTGPGTAVYENTKKLLEKQGIISKLKQDNHDEQFISNYILVQATFQEVKNNSNEYSQDEISTFDKIVKNLDNACNIPDTNLSSFDKDNIAQTRTELFHEEIGNESLRQAKKSNMNSESHAKTYAEMFPEMGDDEMFTKYGKFLEGELKEFLYQYQNNSEIKDKFTEFKSNPNLVDNYGKLLQYNEIKDNPNISDKDKELLENYDKMRSEINKIKEDTETKTKDMMEELCIISQIKGMYMCMGEGDDFNLNKANEIQSENGILTLNGHIDGVGFAIRQDTNNPEARLQTSQKLAKLNDGNTFSIGGTDNFVNSNFILPSQNEIFTSITETVKSGPNTSIEDFENTDDYLENLQTNIMGNMEEIYKDTEYIHHYMKGQVRGEKIIYDILGLIDKISPSFADNESLMKNINQASNKDLYDFMKILKFNIDNSTNTEKDNLDQCIMKILEITNNYKDSNGIESSDSFGYPPIIENYLKNDEWLKDGNEEKKLGLISDLFKYYSENSRDARSSSEGSDGQHSKMIINDLYRDLFEFSSGASEIATNWEIQKRNEEKKKENDKLELVEKNPENLNSILDLENSDIWLT